MEPLLSELAVQILQKVAATPGISAPQLRSRLRRLSHSAFSKGWDEVHDAALVRWQESFSGRDTLRIYLTDAGREKLADVERLSLRAGKRLRPSVLAGAD